MADELERPKTRVPEVRVIDEAHIRLCVEREHAAIDETRSYGNRGVRRRRRAGGGGGARNGPLCRRMEAKWRPCGTRSC